MMYHITNIWLCCVKTSTVTKSDSTAQLKSATKITDKNAHGSKLAGDVVDSSKKLNSKLNSSLLYWIDLYLYIG